MNIVIPLAGEGRRFRDAGYKGPKMLLNVCGRPMLYWALDSLSTHYDLNQAIVICRKTDALRYPLERVIREYCPGARIILLEEATQGQAHTVLSIREHLQLDEPLLIYNGDTYTRYSLPVQSTVQKEPDGGCIVVFRSEKPGYSYVEAGPDRLALQIKEKEPISPFATTGLYYFTQSRLFIEAAEKAMLNRELVRGEYYVAPLYNTLIQQGKQVAILESEYCLPLGTPEELNGFVEWRNSDAR
jgi:dTDP-glucose pyrophosphorylase